MPHAQLSLPFLFIVVCPQPSLTALTASVKKDTTSILLITVCRCKHRPEYDENHAN
jgi:hypothetical protein